MSLAPGLHLRQAQSLVLTPQLQQAIKLLQLSNLEIEAVIAEEVAKNPLLEVARGDENVVVREDREVGDAAPEPQGADQLTAQGEDTYDLVRDVIADLGLGLVRMEQRRHQIAEVFTNDTDDAQRKEAVGHGG